MGYPGQGTTLPAALGIDGEWIIKPHLFLVLGTDPPLADVSPITQTIVVEGQTAHGLDAVILAQNLEITAHDLVALNRKGSLTVKMVAPMRSGYPATVFFRTPKKIFSVEFFGGSSFGDK